MAIMHEVALLRSRITELESANERLSKRQRLKKKRLKKRGSLSVGEAMDLIASNGSSGDLGGNLGGNKGGEGSEPRALWRCSKCRETSHTARTCQND